jgi:signal transduction histidine kinase
LKNLVENGVKYTPAGGKVTVRLTQSAIDRNPQVN